MSEKKLALRAEVSPSHQWNLTPLFPGDAAWDDAYRSASDKINEFDRFKGRLHESVDIFREAIELDLSFGRELDRIATYAHLRNDEDKTNMTYEELYQKAVLLHTAAAEKGSFLVPEMQSLPDEIAEKYLNDPSLAVYRTYLERIFRYRPHTRSHEVEELLAMSGEIFHAPSSIFSQLDNADLTFGSLTNDQGELTELTHGNFSSFLQSKNRDLRKKAFFQYYASYDAHRHTIAASLSSSIKKDHLGSRIRRFESARAKSLFSDDVHQSVYDNLISSVRGRITPLVKYLELRKKILKLDETHFYDTYTPLVSEINFNMPYEEAVDTITKALAPLGTDYCATLRDGLLGGGWVDRYENKGKRSGAYSS
ncbi:MAG TPA: M3 family metallopeptidase, partial [Spirochaetota bacterium]